MIPLLLVVAAFVLVVLAYGLVFGVAISIDPTSTPSVGPRPQR